MPRRSGALRRCTGMGAKPRAPRVAGFGFVMAPYRSCPLVLAHVICVQSRPYHRCVRTSGNRPLKNRGFLRSPGLNPTNGIELYAAVLAAATPFERSAVGL